MGDRNINVEMAKIISFEALKKNKLLVKGKKTVLVGGCFDLIHYGHLQFLKKAKEVGDYLIVALESDEFIKKKKKRDPIHSQGQRAEILASLDMVDLVILLPLFSSDQEYFDMVKTVEPKVIAVTEGDPQIENKRKQAKEIKAILKTVSPLFKNFSTNKIILKFN